MITNHTNQLFISIVAVIVISGTIIITSVIIIIIYIYIYMCAIWVCVKQIYLHLMAIAKGK